MGKCKYREGRIAELEHEIACLSAGGCGSPGPKNSSGARKIEGNRRTIGGRVRRTFWRTDPLIYCGSPIRDEGLEHRLQSQREHLPSRNQLDRRMRETGPTTSYWSNRSRSRLPTSCPRPHPASPQTRPRWPGVGRAQLRLSRPADVRIAIELNTKVARVMRALM